MDENSTREHPHNKQISEIHDLIRQIEKKASPILRIEGALTAPTGNVGVARDPIPPVPVLQDIQGVVEHLREVLARLNY